MAYVPPDERQDNFTQEYLPVLPEPGLPLIPTPDGMVLDNGLFRSPNYAKGKRGWKIDADGNAEFNAGVTTTHLDIPDTTTVNSFHIDTSGNVWWGAPTISGSTASVSSAGVGSFNSISVTGTVNATSGFIGASASALGFEAGGLNVGTTGHVRGSQTDYNTGTGFFLGYSGAAYKFSIGNQTDFLTWDGSVLSVGGKINHLAGDVLYQSADTERSDSLASYTLIKEIKVYRPGVYRIKFDLKSQDNINTVYAKIYKNGSPVGTERSQTSSTYSTYSEDISGVSATDLLELYYKSATSSPTVYNPDANPETTSVDGYVVFSGTHNWATERAEAIGTSSQDSINNFIVQITRDVGGNFNSITRGYLLFDTSNLPDDATIISATLSIYPTAIVNGLSTQSLSVVSVATASNTGLAVGDFNITNFGSTRFVSDVTLGSITTNQYLDMPLNASGLAAISKTGITKFGLLLSGDLDNVEPTGDNSASSITSDTAEGTNKPKLTITYVLTKSFIRNFRLYVQDYDLSTVITN